MARQPVYWPAEESEQPIGGGVIAVLKSKPSHAGYTPYISRGYNDSTPSPLARLSSQASKLRAIRVAPLAIAAATFFLGVILLNLFWVIDHPASPTDLGSLKDLGSFLHSGAAHREGLNPYAYHPLIQPLPISQEGLNLNPPVSVYFFDLLSRFDPSAVKVGFIIISCLSYFGAVFALMRAYPEKRTLLVALAMIALAGFWHMLWYLQLYAPLLLAVVAAWLLIRNGNLFWGGILIGLVIALKPNYAVLPLILLAAGHYRIALPAIGAAAGISAIPLLLDGPQIYTQWLELSVHFPGLTWTSNASLASAGARLGVPFLGTMFAGLLLLGVLYVTWRIRPSALNAMACGLLTVLLLGPVSWAGYTLFLLPFLFSRKWDRVTWVAVLLLAAPFSPEGAVSSVSKTSSSIGLSLPPVRALHDWVLSMYAWVSTVSADIGATVAEPVRGLWNAPVQAATQTGAAIEPLALAFVGSIYVWAVLLLLVRFMWEQARERPAAVPARIRRFN